MKLLVVTIALAASAMAFPIDEQTFNGEINISNAPLSLTQNLSADCKNGVEAIFRDEDQTRARLEEQLEAYFGNCSDEDKAIYATFKKDKAQEEERVYNLIDAAVGAAALTDTQSALYSKMKFIYDDKNTSLNLMEAAINDARNAASEEDRDVLDNLIVKALTNNGDAPV
uniref:DUF148 domain-containing protein n=1 Tax=Rhabditophanes sp. KR3021 TaxID=114890 RepID=A0AC35TP67_9BILA